MRITTENIFLKECIITSVRSFFGEKGFTEVFPTRIGPLSFAKSDADSENLFSLKYYNNEDYFLAQTSQNLLEKYASELGKCYAVVPCYRRQKSRHTQGLSEYWSIEAAWENDSIDSIIETTEAMFHSIYNSLVSMKKGGAWKIDWLSKEYGIAEAGNSAEGNHLGYVVKSRINSSDWTLGRDDNNRELVKSVSFVYSELTSPLQLLSGGVRNTDCDDINVRFEKALRQAGCTDFDEAKKSYKWYFDFKENCNKTLCGFGLGIERLMMCILNCNDIVNVCDIDDDSIVMRPSVK